VAPEQDYADAWRDFGQPPGTRLSWARAGARYELRTEDLHTVASIPASLLAPVAVHPGQQLTDELALAIAVSAHWLRSYFSTDRGGG
jgi:hypothetical protein